MTINKNDIIPALLLFCMVLIVGLYSREILPHYFFNDNKFIRDIMNETVFIEDKSYLNTAYFYKFFFLSGSVPFLVESIISLLLFLIVHTIYTKQIGYKNILVLFLYSIACFLYSVYLTQFSKDQILMLFLITIFIINNRMISKNVSEGKIVFTTVTLLLLYAYFFRDYWYLISLLLVFNHIISRMSIFYQLLGNVMLIPFISSLYILINNQNISFVRSSVNFSRLLYEDINTIILNPFGETGFIYDTLNIYYGIINMLVPLDGIGSLNEVIYYIWIWAFLCFLYFQFKEIKLNFKSILYLNLAISFFIVQGIFEPDMGSVLRHQLPIGIIVLLGVNSKIGKRNEYEYEKKY